MVQHRLHLLLMIQQLFSEFGYNSSVQGGCTSAKRTSRTVRTSVRTSVRGHKKMALKIEAEKADSSSKVDFWKSDHFWMDLGLESVDFCAQFYRTFWDIPKRGHFCWWIAIKICKILRKIIQPLFKMKQNTVRYAAGINAFPRLISNKDARHQKNS